MEPPVSGSKKPKRLQNDDDLLYDRRRQLCATGWLVDRDNLRGSAPAAGHALRCGVDPAFLEDAQDDATLLAIRDMERAGIDIVTDGEVRRESYSNRVATALGGIDMKNKDFPPSTEPATLTLYLASSGQ